MSKIKIYKVPEEKAVQITIGGIDETSIPGLVTFLSALSGETPDIMNLSGVQPLPEEVFNGKENNLVNLAEAEEKIQNQTPEETEDDYYLNQALALAEEDFSDDVETDNIENNNQSNLIPEETSNTSENISVPISTETPSETENKDNNNSNETEEDLAEETPSILPESLVSKEEPPVLEETGVKYLFSFAKKGEPLKAQEINKKRSDFLNFCSVNRIPIGTLGGQYYVTKEEYKNQLIAENYVFFGEK